MTLEDVKNIVGLFFTGQMSADIFSTAYQDGELKLFFQRYAEQDFESLRMFSRVMGDGTPPLYVTDGIADIPEDYFAIEGGYHKVSGKPWRINFIDDRTFDKLVTHKIEFPTIEYPVGNVQANYIRIRPFSIRFVTFSYFVKPSPVKYATTSARGFTEFDTAASSKVMWNEANVVTLIQNILQSFNIKVNQSDIKSKVK